MEGGTTEVEFRHIRLPDGRRLEFADSGPARAPAVLFHHGTPGSGLPYEHVAGPARARGLRLVTISRAGYATSSRSLGRSVADVASDSLAVLDSIGIDRAYTAGVSGGGPHALACAALAPDRFIAALVVAGLAPYEGAGLNFLSGMGEANLVEYAATLTGEPALRRLLEEQAPAFRVGTAQDVISSWQTILPAVDQAVLTGELGDDFTSRMHYALSGTVDGWIDDDIAFVKPWEFNVGEVQVPTAIWHGGADLMVPFAHGQWLAEYIPDVRVHLEAEEGHLSVRVARMPEMLDELISLG
jgi:pimeloyl-ACP methyl ester carboxylesterase